MAIPKTRLPTATPEQFDGATLMRITTSNIKRVRYVDISLDRTVTIVGGDNEQGKTSLLDSIEWCLGKKAAIQLGPIHLGKQQGSIALEFGDGKTVTLKVTKTLKRVGDADWTAEIDIEIPGFVAPTRVEEFLSAIRGELTVDPMAFDEMEAPKQLETMRKLVVGFDFDANQAQYDKLFDERTDVGKDQKKAKAAADVIVVSATAPAEKVDEEALTAELREVGQHNITVAQLTSSRQEDIVLVAELRASAVASLAQIETDIQARTKECNEFVLDLEQQIRVLQQRIVAKQQALAGEAIRIRTNLQTDARDATTQADEIQAKIDAAEALPVEKDAAAIEAKLNEARTTNKAVNDWEAQRDRKAEHQKEADTLANQYEEMTAQLTALQRARQEAIQKAHLPVDGIGFADKHLTLGGVAWEQASEAGRIDASMAIAIAMNPKLKYILIRHASGVGTRIRERICQRAAEHGYRVLMEVYDETGDNSHVFIEDGLVKKLDGQDVPVVEQAPEPAPAADERPALELSASESPPPAAAKKSRKWQGPGAATDVQS